MSAPRLLIIETSGRRGLVAVAHGGAVREARRLDEARRNAVARDLAPAVAELLRGQEWKAADLDAVLVSVGPGSYTGLRVGIMSAKALAYATRCGLVGVPTFAAIARQAPPECDRLDVIADAQQDKVYVQPFARQGESWRPAGELNIRPFDEWLGGRDPRAWVTGPGLAKWRDRLPPDVARAPQPAWEPSAESMLAVGLARYEAGERDDPFALEPLYLRASSAEEQWQGRK
jgi:tRNA threonylcarbamoyladenosine biosynthesis protein TsaB